jgi:transposase
MTTTLVSTKDDLPTDSEKLRSYSWNLTLAYQQLLEKYRKLVGNSYGRSSEKLSKQAELDALQMEMDDLLGQLAAVETKETQETIEEQTVEVTAHRRRRHQYGRNSIPEELIKEVTVDVSESEKICGCCQKPMAVIDTKSHLVVEREPAKTTATRYLRPVYGCSDCKDSITISAPPVVTPIPKGLAGPALMVFVILSKYLYHLPLYRIQRQIFHESRIWFTRSTLSSWVGQACGILERIYDGLLKAYRLSKIKHADESPLPVMVEGHLHGGYMWAGLTGDGRTAVYRYDRHRSGAAALKFLEGSSPGDYLMIDDCQSYNKPVKELKLVVMRCMTHIRRKFVEARDSGFKKEYCKKVLIKIGQLYRIERLATKKEMTTKERTDLRRNLSKQVLDKIKSMLMEPGFVVLPETLTGIAVNYFLRNWEEATRFIESGDLPIDNTADERIIRPFAIGRNNWMQAGSENGARWMATLYSIITTCKLNDIDPEAYLKDVIMRLAIRAENADVSDLLPTTWFKTKNNGNAPAHTPLYPSKH